MSQQLIGHYRLSSKLGEGGMGEVYRATDTKLGRDVAIKVIPAVFAQDADRMARFAREAQVLASLNHPNIAAIYGVEERALVMELVEGPTLAERIAQGPIPLEEALPIARQIAEALEYAHERGVIHRDLKPDNVKITPEGRVKVLDFGLAKALSGDPISGNPASSPTLTMRATVAGVILGTAAYMPPEQAKGKDVDRRADIWAFGVVLAEMLAGRQLYTAETASEVLAAVIMQEPDLSGLPAGTPAAIRKLLRRCLDKDPLRRLQAIGEARIAIEETLAGPGATEEQPPAPPVAARPRSIYPWITASVLAIALAALAFMHFREKPSEAALVRFTISPPEKTAFVLTGPNPNNGPPVLSPDGRRLAFNARMADGKVLTWVRSLDTLRAQPLEGTEGANYPFWSADGRSLGFFADAKLKTIDASGGPPRTLSDAFGFGGTWNRDGVIVFSPAATGPLRRVPAAGGPSTPVTSLDQARHETTHRWPWFLPDGRHFLYLAVAGERSSIRIGSLDGGQSKPVLENQLNAVYAQGYLLFARETTLMAQPFDVQRLVTSADAVPIVEQIGVPPIALHGLFSVSENGFLVYSTGSATTNQLAWFDRSGRQTATLGDPGETNFLELSPDGKYAATAINDSATRNPDVWIYDVARGLKTRFTFDPADERQPVWSPDARSVVFSSNRNGHFDLFQKHSSGVGNEELLFADGLEKFATSWSPDGKFLLFDARGDSKTKNDLWVLPVTPERSGERKPIRFAQTPFNEMNGQFSPDGRRIAYQSDESRRYEIYVAPFPGPGGKRQISTAGGVEPRWRRDGKEIYYVAPDLRLMAAAVSVKGDVLEVGAVSPLFAVAGVGGGYRYDVSADGQHFLVRTAPNATTEQRLTVVQNWTAALKQH
ncbi:MAG TPA: protein kinase [Bryobacteraceae bacterium]|nr:protein kinase [Bryobacteraceae bacterium]